MHLRRRCDRLILPDQASPVICIVSPKRNVYSETFIRAHIERLPAKVTLLYGGYFPQYQDDDRLLISSSMPLRLSRAIARRVFRLSGRYFQQSALKRFLLKNGVSAVLAEYGPTGVAVMEVCKEAGVPLIVHFHGYDAYEDRTLGQNGQHYPELFENATSIIAVSRDMQCQLLRLGAPKEKVSYNPYGVDISLFQRGNPAQAPSLFVAVGRFVDKKAPYLTLLAFKKVVESVSEARLIMIGDGPLLEACKQMTKALDVDNAVEFLGRRPHMEVAATMQRARAFVQHSIRPSHGDSEGTPVAVLEAGATGIPVIATRHAGIQDVVVDGRTGLLVDERDIDGMAECMIRIAEDPTLAARLGQVARKRICAEFSMEKSIDNLWHIIEASIQENR